MNETCFVQRLSYNPELSGVTGGLLALRAENGMALELGYGIRCVLSYGASTMSTRTSSDGYR